MVASMPLDLPTQASTSAASSQVSDSIKTQACLRWRLEMSKHAVGLHCKFTNALSSATGDFGALNGGRSHFTLNIDFNVNPRKSSKTRVFASMPAMLPVSMQVASRLFTFGTAFVVPFYTIMILAPRASWTKKLVESSFPYAVLGVLYLYLLFLSWSPETLSLMFASKYWLPELPGITRMFSNTLTVASAWLHLLAVDLFAGRQIYLDGLQHAVETRHSLVLCLLFCPVGMLSHFFTKAIVRRLRKASNEEVPDVAKLYS